VRSQASLIPRVASVPGSLHLACAAAPGEARASPELRTRMWPLPRRLQDHWAAADRAWGRVPIGLARSRLSRRLEGVGGGRRPGNAVLSRISDQPADTRQNTLGRSYVPAGYMERVSTVEKEIEVSGGQQGNVRGQAVTVRKPADSNRTPADSGCAAELEQLLTGQEVIEQLRLDVGRKCPKEALKNMRRMRKIGFVRVGRRVLYRRQHVEELIAAEEVKRRG